MTIQTSHLHSFTKVIKLIAYIKKILCKNCLYADYSYFMLGDCEELEEATGTIVTLADTTTFQEQVTKPFIAHLKENIFSHFSSLNDVISAISIFDPRKASMADSQTPNLSK